MLLFLLFIECWPALTSVKSLFFSSVDPFYSVQMMTQVSNCMNAMPSGNPGTNAGQSDQNSFLLDLKIKTKREAALNAHRGTNTIKKHKHNIKRGVCEQLSDSVHRNFESQLMKQVQSEVLCSGAGESSGGI